jgi:hypothetical protein
MISNDKIRAAIAVLMLTACVLAVTFIASNTQAASALWGITRVGSSMGIDDVGTVYLSPKSGKTVQVSRTLAANGGMTVPTAKTVAVTDPDALTVGGVIVPQSVFINWTNVAATSASGDFAFIANRAYQVTAIRVAQRAQGGSGCVIDVEKLTGTTAPGSGTALGTGSYNCNSTANNTATTYTLTGTTGTLQLAAGDRLSVKLGGTLTALAGATVTVQLKAI